MPPLSSGLQWQPQHCVARVQVVGSRAQALGVSARSAVACRDRRAAAKLTPASTAAAVAPPCCCLCFQPACRTGRAGDHCPPAGIWGVARDSSSGQRRSVARATAHHPAAPSSIGAIGAFLPHPEYSPSNSASKAGSAETASAVWAPSGRAATAASSSRPATQMAGSMAARFGSGCAAHHQLVAEHVWACRIRE